MFFPGPTVALDAPGGMCPPGSATVSIFPVKELNGDSLNRCEKTSCDANAIVGLIT